MDHNEAIGKWLAHEREARGMLQSEIGEKLGVTKTAVHYWETGKRTINADTMLKYCDALGVDPQILVIEITRKKGE